MGKKLTDEFLKWTLDVDGKPAMAALNSLEQSTKKLQNTNRALTVEMAKLEAQGKKNGDEYKNLDKQFRENNNTINQAKSRMADLRKEIGVSSLTAAQLRQRMSELKRSMDQSVPNSAAWKQHKKELEEVAARYRQVSGAAGNTKSVFGGLKELLPAMGVAAVIAGLGAIITKSIGVRTEFSKYEAVLKNTLGSQKEANSALDMLSQFAATTPFQLQELTGSYVKLVNQGFKPTKTELTSLGDLAASQGKSFDQLTEAILDAQQNQNERLREFGIRGEKNGDKIKYTFKGVTTEVDNNATAIRSYILSLGNLQGVAGGMASISKTIGGAISNTSDATDSLFNAIGKKLEPAIVSVLGIYQKLIGAMSKSIDSDPSREFNKQQIAVKELDATLSPLISEYATLSAKTSLSAAEQGKLKSVIGQIAGIVPGAISGMDQYGNAIAINADKAKEFIKAQKAMLGVMNANAIEDSEGKLKGVNKEFERLKKLVDAGGVQESIFGRYGLSDSVLTEIKVKMKTLGDEKLGLETMIKSLKGESLVADAGADAKKPAVDKIKQMEKELDLINARVAVTDKEIAARNKDSEAVEKEIAALKALGTEKGKTVKTKTEEKTVKDEHKKELDAAEKFNSEQVALINKKHLTEKTSETQFDAELLQQEFDYLKAKRDIFKVGSKEYEDADAVLQGKLVKSDEQVKNMLLQAQKELTDAKIENLQEGLDKERAIEEQRWAEELARLKEKLHVKQILDKEDVAYNETINKIIQEKTAAHQKKTKDITTAGELAKQMDSAIFHEAKAQTNAEKFDAERELAQATYDQELKDANGNAAKTAKAERHLSDELIRIKTAELDKRQEIGDAVFNAANNIFGGLSDLVGKETALGKALFLFQQAAAIGQIVFNTAIANAKAVASSPWTGGMPWVAINTASAAVSIASVVAQAIGSFSGKKGKRTGGYADNDASDFTPVGVYHANEFIASGPAVRNPTVKPILDIIDIAQRTGTIQNLNLASVLSGGRQAGGYASGNVSGSHGFSVLDPELKALLKSLKEQIDGGITANVNPWGVNGLDYQIKRINKFNALTNRK